jgi:hypothetical protein
MSSKFLTDFIITYLLMPHHYRASIKYVTLFLGVFTPSPQITHRHATRDITQFFGVCTPPLLNLPVFLSIFLNIFQLFFSHLPPKNRNGTHAQKKTVTQSSRLVKLP